MMEIPFKLKKLYRHWEDHTIQPEKLESKLSKDRKFLEIVEFANERMNIWYRKDQGYLPPYSKDPILNHYRFCNIYRELDKQTIEIHSSILDMRKDFDIWLLNLAFNRFLCNPDTFKKIGFLNFDSKNNEDVKDKLIKLPRPKYGSAYIFPISIIQKGDFPTRESFLTQYLPSRIKEISKIIRKFNKIGVSDALTQILPAFGYNFKFHWTEILIDVAYQFPEYIDLFKRFPIGPGSLPTMKMFSNKLPEETNIELSHIVLDNFPYLSLDGKNIYLSAENWEGIGCEYCKYTNLKNGYGRKRRYSKANYS